MNPVSLTNEELRFIEADLRDHAVQTACKDCRRRIELADKVARLLDG